MEPVVSYTQRGKMSLIVESASFVENGVLKSGETSWRCSNRTCKAKLYTIGSEFLIVRKDINHTHEIDSKKTNRQIISASVKRKATEDLHEKPSKIIHKELVANKICLETISVKDQTYIRTNLYNARRKILPTQPKSIEETCDAIEKANIKTAKEENAFLQSFSRLAQLRAEKSNVELESKPSTSAASNEEFLVENSSDLPIEHVDAGSTSSENFLPETDEPSLPKHKGQKFVAARDMKTYCRLCLNPANKDQMVCLGDFHDINYPSRTVQFKRNKILQTEGYRRMIRTLMPNFNPDLVYNPIMCNDCSTRLQMASDFVEQCMATQNLIQQYKDTYCPAEKLVSCEDVVHNKSHLLPETNQAVPSNPKKRKIAKPVPQQPTETVSYNEDFQTLENVNVKTEQFEEMENEEKYEITPEEVCAIKQEFVEEETMINTNETEITLPVDRVVKNEPSSEISDYNIVANEQSSKKQFSNTEVDSIYNTNYLVGVPDVPAQFCPPTLPAQYCPPNDPVASETFVSSVKPVTTQNNQKR